MIVLVFDADAIIPLLDETHVFHDRLKKLNEKLIKHKPRCLFPITALAEAMRHFQTANQPELAWALVEIIKRGTIRPQSVVPIDDQIFKGAMQLFDPWGDAGDTFFDAIVATIARQNNARAVVSFDDGYRKMEVPLAEDVFR